MGKVHEVDSTGVVAYIKEMQRRTSRANRGMPAIQVPISDHIDNKTIERIRAMKPGRAIEFIHYTLVKEMNE